MARIKICGLSRPCDIDFVNEAKPDYIGFVFANSRRRVTPLDAAAMRARLDSSIVPVGVFVNEDIGQIARLYGDGVIAAAQLHGDEDDVYIEKLRAVCGIQVIKAIRVKSRKDIIGALDSLADCILYDSAAGSGERFAWHLAKDAPRVFFLAGGINESNIKDALALSPFCVDVSSGAETGGVKDREKIKRLVRLVRENEEEEME